MTGALPPFIPFLATVLLLSPAGCATGAPPSKGAGQASPAEQVRVPEGHYLAWIQGEHRELEVLKGKSSALDNIRRAVEWERVAPDAPLLRTRTDDRSWKARDVLWLDSGRAWLVGVPDPHEGRAEVLRVGTLAPSWVGQSVSFRFPDGERSLTIRDTAHAKWTFIDGDRNEIVSAEFRPVECGDGCQGFFFPNMDEAVLTFVSGAPGANTGFARLVRGSRPGGLVGTFARGGGRPPSLASMAPVTVWPQELLGTFHVSVLREGFPGRSTILFEKGQWSLLGKRTVSPRDRQSLRLFQVGGGRFWLEVRAIADGTEKAVEESRYELVSTAFGWLVASLDHDQQELALLPRGEPPPWTEGERFRREQRIWCESFESALSSEVGPRRRFREASEAVKQKVGPLTAYSALLSERLQQLDVVMAFEAYRGVHAALGIEGQCPALQRWVEQKGEAEQTRAAEEDQQSYEAEEAAELATQQREQSEDFQRRTGGFVPLTRPQDWPLRLGRLVCHPHPEQDEDKRALDIVTTNIYGRTQLSLSKGGAIHFSKVFLHAGGVYCHADVSPKEGQAWLRRFKVPADCRRSTVHEEEAPFVSFGFAKGEDLCDVAGFEDKLKATPDGAVLLREKVALETFLRSKPTGELDDKEGRFYKARLGVYDERLEFLSNFSERYPGPPLAMEKEDRARGRYSCSWQSSRDRQDLPEGRFLSLRREDAGPGVHETYLFDDGTVQTYLPDATRGVTGRCFAKIDSARVHHLHEEAVSLSSESRGTRVVAIDKPPDDLVVFVAGSFFIIGSDVLTRSAAAKRLEAEWSALHVELCQGQCPKEDETPTSKP